MKHTKPAPRAVCAQCGKTFEDSDYAALSRAIMKMKPACSFECNVKLGQAKAKK